VDENGCALAIAEIANKNASFVSRNMATLFGDQKERRAKVDNTVSELFKVQAVVTTSTM
jgi:hypothetical protein